MLQSILTREVETWKQMDKMKRVLEKFRFELEEEVLKGKLDKFFASSKLQEQSLSTIDQVQTYERSAPLPAARLQSCQGPCRRC